MGGLLSMLGRALDCRGNGNKEAGHGLRGRGVTGLSSLAQLEGHWRLARRIVMDDGSEGALEGTCTFRRAGHRLIQDEEGLLRLPLDGPPLRATRRYVWAAETGRLEVLFEDNRPFHTVPLGVVRPETTYLCPPDRYAVTYEFGAFPRWRSVWRVEGPKKAYVMTTDYSPA
jgi:hypothetical protein